MTIEKKLFHEDEGEWIEAHVVIDDGGNLSLTGSQGVIVPEDEARDMAREYWHSFFDDCPESIIDMNRRCGSNCHDSETATDYVLEVDGDLHGLDVWREDDERVYILESCGQITDDLISAFPVLKDIAPWHLNQMNAGCEHQDELGWGRDRDIALDRASATEIQIRVIEDLDRRKVIEDAEREWDKSDRRLRFKTLKALGKGSNPFAHVSLRSVYVPRAPSAVIVMARPGCDVNCHRR